MPGNGELADLLNRAVPTSGRQIDMTGRFPGATMTGARRSVVIPDMIWTGSLTCGYDAQRAAGLRGRHWSWLAVNEPDDPCADWGGPRSAAARSRTGGGTTLSEEADPTATCPVHGACSSTGTDRAVLAGRQAGDPPTRGR